MISVIPDSFWAWPSEYEAEASPLDRCAKELAAVLERGVLCQFLTGPQGNLAEFIALQAREWCVNPWWAIISAQREQSAIEAKDLPESALNKVMGYVGLDSGHLVLPGYYGAFNQVYRSISQISWYMNQRPDVRKGKTTPRWKPGTVIQVKDTRDAAAPFHDYKPASMTEFVQLLYTCHLTVLPENFELGQRYCPRFLVPR